MIEDYEQITIESYNQTVDAYLKNVEALHLFEESKKFFTYIGKEKKTILDLGCGGGRDAVIFVEQGHDVIGIDASYKMIEAAKRRVPSATFEVMDIRRLTFRDSSIDGVWASASFLHIPKKDIQKGLQEVYRVLKDTGIFYVLVKQGEGEVLTPDMRYNGVQKFWSFFQKEEIEEALLIAGFDILSSSVEKTERSYDTHPWIHVFCKK